MPGVAGDASCVASWADDVMLLLVADAVEAAWEDMMAVVRLMDLPMACWRATWRALAFVWDTLPAGGEVRCWMRIMGMGKY